jgi:hypothetical protein
VELMAHMHVAAEKQRTLDLARTEHSLRKLAEAQARTEKIANRRGRFAMLIARDHEAWPAPAIRFYQVSPEIQAHPAS